MKKKFNNNKPRLLVISHVLPFPGAAGQQQRVRYKLQALREQFHITFLTTAPAAQVSIVTQELALHCDEPLVLASHYNTHPATKIAHRAAAIIYTLITALKSSNYLIGKVEFTAKRLAPLLDHRLFDAVLYEYWHAVDSTDLFKARQIPTVLDMHNILWQSYQRQLETLPRLPAIWRRWAMAQYQQREEAAWQRFDALIAINTAERDYVYNLLPTKPLFYAPMGIDLTQWPYSWQPTDPPRIAYYGGLGSIHNQHDAWRCYANIMPKVWACYPDAELWLVGNNPPAHLRQIPTLEPRVHVTGFVDNVQGVLATASLILCPWTGKYGFRSRLIEAMALGVPVVTTSDAVYGMNLQDQQGILLAESDEQLAHQVLRLLDDEAFAAAQSQMARQTIAEQYSFSATYERLATELRQWISVIKQCPEEAEPS